MDSDLPILEGELDCRVNSLLFEGGDYGKPIEPKQDMDLGNADYMDSGIKRWAYMLCATKNRGCLASNESSARRKVWKCADSNCSWKLVVSRGNTEKKRNW
jgi:hypothetical protein